MALMAIAICVAIDSLAMFFVVHVVALIGITCCVLLTTTAMLLAMLPLTFIQVPTIGIEHLTFPMRLAW